MTNDKCSVSLQCNISKSSNQIKLVTESPGLSLCVLCIQERYGTVAASAPNKGLRRLHNIAEGPY